MCCSKPKQKVIGLIINLIILVIFVAIKGSYKNSQKYKTGSRPNSYSAANLKNPYSEPDPDPINCVRYKDTFNYTAIIEESDAIAMAKWLEDINKNSANSNTSQRLVAKLTEIRSISLPWSGANVFDNCTEICYTEECLDSALHILKSLNISVNPCDDFYEFTCGNWIAENPVPVKLTSWTQYDVLAKKVMNTCQKILESPIGMTDPKPVKQAKQMYSMCMDNDELITRNYQSGKTRRNKKGVKYLVESYEKLYGGSLVDKNYNLKVAKQLANKTGTLITDKKPMGQVQDEVIELETKLTSSSNFQQQQRGAPHHRYRRHRHHRHCRHRRTNYKIEIPSSNSRSRDKFEMKTVVNNLLLTSAGSLKTATNTNASNEANGANFKKEERNPKFVISHRNQYIRKLNDLHLKKSDKCVDLILRIYETAIEYEFITKYFNKQAKTSVGQMVDTIRQSFDYGIYKSKWLDRTTQVAVNRKLQQMKKRIGFPDELLSRSRLEMLYSGLAIVPGDYYKSLLLAYLWKTDAYKEYEEMQRNLGNMWQSPLTVNAFHIFHKNIVEIPAGILQPPIYTQGGLEALKYAGIGTTIGHEITHGFDDNGIKLLEWPSLEFRENFVSKADCFKKQYNKFTTVEGPVDGNLTLSENIADNGGLRHSFFAYRKWIRKNRRREERRLPGLEMFTPNQLFFISFASRLCKSETQQDIRESLIDSHSPARFQLIGPLQNFEQFSTEWNCPIGSSMNPPIDKKCVLW